MEQEERDALLLRGVEALERLGEDPVIQVETAPPVCPHCEMMNPNVRVSDTEGEGPLAEIVIQAHCLRCGNTFIAIPLQMDCVKTISDATELMEERLAQRGYGGNGQAETT